MCKAQLRLLAQVDLGDEEFQVLFDVTVQHGRGAFGDAIPVLREPGFESGALMCRENENVVFADGVLRLYRHAERLFPLALERGAGFGHRVHGPAFGVQEPAGIGIEVLDEPWCRIIG